MGVVSTALALPHMRMLLVGTCTSLSTGQTPLGADDTKKAVLR